MTRPFTRYSRWLFCFVLLLYGHLYAQHATASKEPELNERSEKMLEAIKPNLLFEENRGQFDAEYRYKALDRQASYFFMDREVRTVVEKADGKSAFTYSLKFVEPLAKSVIKGQELGKDFRRGTVNYLTSGGMLSDIPNYKKLRYENVWKSIDALFQDSDRNGLT